MMLGVTTRGTAAQLAVLGRPIAGKTGTTNDSRDNWFIGSTPDYTIGIYVGFDEPRTLGGNGDRRRHLRAGLRAHRPRGLQGQAAGAVPHPARRAHRAGRPRQRPAEPAATRSTRRSSPAPSPTNTAPRARGPPVARRPFRASGLRSSAAGAGRRRPTPTLSGTGETVLTINAASKRWRVDGRPRARIELLTARLSA